MNFVFQRDRTIASTLGHVIFFPKNTPTYAPSALHREVMEAGGIPEGEMEDPRNPVESTAVPEPTDPIKRGEDIQAAIEMIATRNASADFTANGAPHVKALTAMLGWKPSNNERDVQWARFQNKDD